MKDFLGFLLFNVVPSAYLIGGVFLTLRVREKGMACGQHTRPLALLCLAAFWPLFFGFAFAQVYMHSRKKATPARAYSQHAQSEYHGHE